MLCKCEKKKSRKIKQIGFWDGCPLEKKAHTNFVVLRCLDCNGIVGFPEFNFNLAINEGTLETKSKLAEIISR